MVADGEDDDDPDIVTKAFGQQGGAMASTSCRINILHGCLLPFSVMQESSAFSTYLGNQLGITIMVRGFRAGHWVVVVVCLSWVGVSVEAVPGEGSRVGVDHHQEGAASGTDDLWKISNTGWQLVG